MKRVLVTGANGQLGQSILSISEAYSALELIFTDREELDITNGDTVRSFFRENRPDYCINCAAYTQVDQAEKEPDKCFQINVDGVENLVHACSEVDCVFVHISTDFVFDGKKGSPYSPEDRPNPINVYGLSKYKSEQAVQDTLQKYFIIRTSWVYSEFGKNFFKTIIRLGAEQDELRVVSDQYGSPTYAGDLARLLLFVCTHEGWKFGIYHFSNSGETTWLEFAREILLHSGSKCLVKPITSESFGAVAKRPGYSVLSDERIPPEFFWPWRQSLAICLKRFKDLPNL